MSQREVCLNYDDMKEWLISQNVEDVECMIPDLSGIARGKVIPTEKFISGLNNNSLFVPYDILTQTVTGHYSNSHESKKSYRDLRILPDPTTIRLVPWVEGEPVAQIICDVSTFDKEVVSVSSREVLKTVLDHYRKLDLTPIIAPEIEFYLVQKNLDPDYPLVPAKGQSERYETGSQAYGIEALNEYDTIIDLIYHYCDKSSLDVDTILHESGSAQLEVNFVHGNPLDLADQIFLFKRTSRKAAFKHNTYLTFMAKPHSNQPGSSMHIHQSVIDSKGKNIFSDSGKKYSKNFFHFIGGLQKYFTEASLIFYPNINSYRRIHPGFDAPINIAWGVDNRTVGLRVPIAESNAVRVENRLPGADVNPYLSFAASLVLGLEGMKKNVQCYPESKLSEENKRTVPYHLHEALKLFEESEVLKKYFGSDFIDLYSQVKLDEIDIFNRLVTAWERENLLLTI